MLYLLLVANFTWTISHVLVLISPLDRECFKITTASRKPQWEQQVQKLEPNQKEIKEREKDKHLSTAEPAKWKSLRVNAKTACASWLNTNPLKPHWQSRGLLLSLSHTLYTVSSLQNLLSHLLSLLSIPISILRQNEIAGN